MISGQSRHLAGDSSSASAAGSLVGGFRQQCVAHLTLARQATANVSFHRLRTGTTDPYAQIPTMRMLDE